MKVGLLIDRWDPQRGGAEACLGLLAKHLVSSGHEVHVIAASAREPLPGAFQRVRGLGLTRGVRERRLGRNMTAAAQGLGCDVTVAVRHVEQPTMLWLHGGAHRATLEARWRAAHREAGSCPGHWPSVGATGPSWSLRSVPWRESGAAERVR